MDFGSPSSLVFRAKHDSGSRPDSSDLSADALGLSAEEIKKLPVSDRLRLAINVLDLAPALELPVTFVVHPINLFVTKDAQVKMLTAGFRV